MEKIKNDDKLLRKSGTIVACRNCGKPLTKKNFVKCAWCGSYLCEDCAWTHYCRKK